MKTAIWIIVLVGAALLLKQRFLGRAAQEDIASTLKQNTALVVDVRTRAEFNSGHYEGALNIPLQDLAGELGQLGPDKTRPIVLYCHSGARAAAAQRQLQDAGYTAVINAGSLHRMTQLQ